MLWPQVEWLLSRKGPMQAASVSQSMQSVERGALRARHAELGGQLRVAVMEGDEARIRRLLSELLRGQGLSKAQRISVQLKALLSLVQSLRCATVTDELTGLCNQRGFVQTGTRLLDVAARDGSAATSSTSRSMTLRGSSKPWAPSWPTRCCGRWGTSCAISTRATGSTRSSAGSRAPSSPP